MGKLLICTAIVFLAISLSMAAPAVTDPCRGEALNATMVRCMTENGFTMAQISKLIPSSSGAISFSGADFSAFCNNREGYYKASSCIVDEMTRCQLTNVLIHLNINNTAKAMNMICDDPSFKTDCMTLLTKDTLVLQSCLTTKYDFAKEMETKSIQQVTCESAKIAVQCSVDILKTCDQHTATVFGSAQDLVVPSVC